MPKVSNAVSPSCYVAADDIRSAFSAAMSDMYRREVPAYGSLLTLVADVNADTLSQQPELAASLGRIESIDRLSEERHGAIRLGKPSELAMMRRVFALMGMYPVGYYDLSTAGIPVHSTAFRPVEMASLNRNPFRIFTSLLRLDLIEDETLRAEAEATLEQRDIFLPETYALVEKAEAQGGLDSADADRFVEAVLETFRWHQQANVDADLYRRLHGAHRLVADVVSFKGPHINHLTPRTLDIDRVQSEMPERGITPKAVVEGPPLRDCPILLRQTSFKALDEAVSFRLSQDQWEEGSHTARFGEIEQRGCALTPKGRALYDELLAEVRRRITPAADGSNASEYVEVLTAVFRDFPDTYEALRAQGLAYFVYSVTEAGRAAAVPASALEDIDTCVAEGWVQFDPMVYEDFLPVSAAGIFQSNLGDGAAQAFEVSPNQALFEQHLAASVLDECAHYAKAEQDSLEACQRALQNRYPSD